MRWVFLCLCIFVSTVCSIEKSSLSTKCESKKLLLVYPDSKSNQSNGSKGKFPRNLSLQKKDNRTFVVYPTRDILVAAESRDSTNIQENKADNIDSISSEEHSKKFPHIAQNTTDSSNTTVFGGKRKRPLGYLNTRRTTNKTRIALRKPQRKPNDISPDLINVMTRRNNLFSAPKIRNYYFAKLAGKRMPKNDTINVMSEPPLNIRSSRRGTVSSDKAQTEIKSEMEPKRSRMLRRN